MLFWKIFELDFQKFYEIIFQTQFQKHFQKVFCKKIQNASQMNLLKFYDNDFQRHSKRIFRKGFPKVFLKMASQMMFEWAARSIRWGFSARFSTMFLKVHLKMNIKYDCTRLRNSFQNAFAKVFPKVFCKCSQKMNLHKLHDKEFWQPFEMIFRKGCAKGFWKWLRKCCPNELSYRLIRRFPVAFPNDFSNTIFIRILKMIFLPTRFTIEFSKQFLQWYPTRLLNNDFSNDFTKNKVLRALIAARRAVLQERVLIALAAAAIRQRGGVALRRRRLPVATAQSSCPPPALRPRANY
jgi:hypothetical protein